MQHSAGRTFEARQRLYFENEVQNNRMASRVLLAIGLLMLLLVPLGKARIYNIGPDICWKMFLVAGLLDLAAFGAGYSTGFRSPWTKWLLLVFILLTSALRFFLYPFECQFLTYGPIVISILYYDPRLVRRTALASWVLFVLALLVNWELERISPVIQELHAYLETGYLWSSLHEIFIELFLSHSIFYILTTVICMRIAKRGRGLVEEQADAAARISEMDAQMRAAEGIQQSSLPPGHLLAGDARIFALMRAAKTVGGDFYDYFRDGERMYFLLADVSDKGLPAAMFMMRAKNAIRTAIQREKGLGSALKEANCALCTENDSNMFVTVWIGWINVFTGQGSFVSCGHPAPLLLSGEGSRWLDCNPSPPLGLFEDAEYESNPLCLNPGSRLVAFTDGMTDALNHQGADFGLEGLKTAMEALSPETPNPCQELVNRVDAFAHGTQQFDDMTVLAVERDRAEVTGELEIPADGEAPGKAVLWLEKMLAKVQCPEDQCRRISTVLDEICSNVAENAYPNGEGTMTLTALVSRGKALLSVADRGIPFNPLEFTAEDEDILSGDGGLGIRIIRGMTDDIGYHRGNGENCLSFIKRW